jgi:hypothetical protein
MERVRHAYLFFDILLLTDLIEVDVHALQLEVGGTIVAVKIISHVYMMLHHYHEV